MTTSCTPIKAKWHRVESHGDVPTPRHGYRADAKDDMLIIYGGGDGRLVYSDLFVLQTITGQWKKVPLFTLPERAGFGLAIIEDYLYVFGGMSYYRRFLNDLYYLSLLTWKWDVLLPRLAPGTPPPCARVGHTFTKINDQMIILFGGVTEPAGHWMYLNDLYALIFNPDGTCMWRLISVNGIQPPARESHSACLYKPDSGGEKLIIYGGMCGERLDDIWALDISTYTWCQYQVPIGTSPPPRSMHGATIAGSRMFVFGGWAPADKYTDTDVFISPQNLSCFNLIESKWEKLDEQSSNGCFPYPRTGHNMVMVQDKIFLWSGRTGANYHDDVSVENDLWCLQVTPEKVLNRLILSNKAETMIKVEWDPVPLATHYLLQIQVMPMAPINPESTVSPSSISMNQNRISEASIQSSNNSEPLMDSFQTSTNHPISTQVHIPTTFNPQPLSASSKKQYTIPRVTTRVPIPITNNNLKSFRSSQVVTHQNPVSRVSTPTPGISISNPGISAPISSFSISNPEISTQTPGISTQTPGISTSTPGISTQTPGISTSTAHISTPNPGISTSTPGISNQMPGIPTQTPGISPPTPGISIPTPGGSTIVISTPVSTTPIAPQKSTLETFLKPKPILSRPSSVKLMRSSSGKPLAVVPKSLIPNRTISCGTKPSNIVIVARKRPYL